MLTGLTNSGFSNVALILPKQGQLLLVPLLELKTKQQNAMLTKVFSFAVGISDLKGSCN